MVANLCEIDATNLRQAISTNKDILLKLWKIILPSTLLRLQKSWDLDLPKSLLEKPWKDTWGIINDFTELMVIGKDEEVSISNGGFLLQGSVV